MEMTFSFFLCKPNTMKKYFILLILPLLLSCQKEVAEEYHHNITVTPICNNGYDDCMRGVDIVFRPPYQSVFTVEAYLPIGVDVCSITVSGFEPYTENVPTYLYFQGIAYPGKTIRISVSFVQPNLPMEGIEMTFGRWVTHFNQEENPSVWHLTEQCNLSRN